MKRWRLAVLVWASFCLALGAKAQFSAPPNPIFGRKYTVGERYCYRLTLKEYHDDKLALTNVSVCQLRVVTNDKGVPFDQVQWLSKKVVYDKDTVDQSGSARAVNPYLISLDPRGTVMLPKIEDPKMTEAIEDFNTFFVALGPMFYGVNRLVNKGDSLVVGFPIVADFSNGSTILKG